MPLHAGRRGRSHRPALALLGGRATPAPLLHASILRSSVLLSFSPPLLIPSPVLPSPRLSSTPHPPPLASSSTSVPPPLASCGCSGGTHLAKLQTRRRRPSVGHRVTQPRKVDVRVALIDTAHGHEVGIVDLALPAEECEGGGGGRGGGCGGDCVVSAGVVGVRQDGRWERVDGRGQCWMWAWGHAEPELLATAESERWSVA